ncbi:Putative calcineurin-like phosphoesterase domain, ApaH type, metallo-dependent phosphatase [Septoria linicola]|uniref:Calcineurin-like phosphoesterase domain, ApaH type, metallo-dependent phosphatase n=1 Tax=Septoria linicola TaxID=215465 RepID=A0A9Q9EKM2_9PEZI|nr:putative calcineurin-like phosphoesterase domain, ApaH type, metallo-dependent phosphatase [Septoria linicola]USW52533.1 Putative calcineurin-like phosphoesterase domain, ApaH type, metallo-dependent phosphatase [Septoria linicola]
MEETLGDLKAKLKAQQQQHAEAHDHRAVSGSPHAFATSPRGAGEKRPLIEQVNNQWQHEKHDVFYGADEATHDDEREYGCCDLEDDTSCPNTARDLVASRRFRRMLALLLLIGVAAYYAWTRYFQPIVAEEWEYKLGFMEQNNGTYGVARGGHDKDLVRIKSLEPSLLPGGIADPDGSRRLVFVGDIHGCKKELLKLLDKVDFNEDTDHLVLVGDTVTKGPDNLGVLDELIRLNATSVRGNHEDRLLHVAKKLHADTPLPIESSSSKGFAKDAALVRELKHRHLDYMREMPLMLHIPRLPMARSPTKKRSSPINEHIIVVHAGLVPGVSLKKQDPYFVMNMRSINRRTLVPSALRDGKNAKPWYGIWCWYNDRIFKGRSMEGLATTNDFRDEEEQEQEVESIGWFRGPWKNFFGQKKAHPKPQVVIYGHDSKTGLVIERWSKGLDSGCVSGGKLTALVLNAKGEQDLVHVKCKNYRD